MLLSRLWEYFQQNIFTLAGTTNGPPLFNPYARTVINMDTQNASNIRRGNVRNYLAGFHSKPPVLVIGEAPGWRGCRFSGIPFTSEAQLTEQTLPFSGLQSSKHHKPYREATATIFWRVMKDYHPNFLVWNCIPLHPHLPGEPRSNRRPNTSEIYKYAPLLEELIYLLQPAVVIAVGRSAQTILTSFGINIICLRHPSHGGSVDFEAGMRQIFPQTSP
jgi:uracil-DNA glycosylase